MNHQKVLACASSVVAQHLVAVVHLGAGVQLPMGAALPCRVACTDLEMNRCMHSPARSEAWADRALPRAQGLQLCRQA